LLEWYFSKYSQTQNLLDCVKRGLRLEPFFHDGDPDLRLDCILSDTLEPLVPEMLFGPFEGQLYLPAATIKLGDDQRRKIEIGGQKDQMPAVFGIVELDLL
jgi:hypothetical protein